MPLSLTLQAKSSLNRNLSHSLIFIFFSRKVMSQSFFISCMWQKAEIREDESQIWENWEAVSEPLSYLRVAVKSIIIHYSNLLQTNGHVSY